MKVEKLENLTKMFTAGFDNIRLLEAYDQIMALNLRSVVQLTQLAVPHLKQTKGCIVNISSDSSIKPVRQAKE